ncbi:glycogen(starch) synthase [Nitrosospira sp. Nsp11]|uniref:glycosyltransferase family 4 protein n=1 Tax=Nitrosospira sp. Nsp11 TaxID=1855338 RepID=UPI000915E79C|nr:glycosyltransferase family 4 protein [Nitrosospira sp. Nsp11]SHM15045.1 glycogen(starch) synthase [Nitrosospira sp. Nsp11]
MRVLHLTSEYPPVVWGGLGTVVGGLTVASAQAGIEVDVLLIRHDGQLSYGHLVPSWTVAVSVEEALAGRTMSINIFQVSHTGAAIAAIKLAQDRKPDVIHIHPVELWPVAKAIKQATGISVVYTVHSLNLAEYEFGNEPPEILNLWHTQQALIAGADRVLALTQDEKSLLLECYSSALDHVRVVGNGISDSAAARHSAGKKRRNESPLVLYSGRFVDRKGIHELFRAIPMVLQTAPNTKFVFVGGYGSGPDIERAWLPAELFPYRTQIQFTGWLNTIEVGKWYEQVDILVVPSWYEPFGMVVLEGMLYGLPIAASNVGGPAEILEHGNTGLLFLPKNVETLADALLTLVANPEFREHLGANAAVTVREKWLWPRIVDQMKDIYQQVI